MRTKTHHWTVRGLSAFLAALQVCVSLPAFAWATPIAFPQDQPGLEASTGSRSEHKASVVHHEPFPVLPQFTAAPTAEEFYHVRLFAQPLVPAGSTTPTENVDLARTLQSFAGNPGDLTPLLAFLEQHPASAWKPALLLNLGNSWRRTGFMTRALRAWEEAWTLTKDSSDLHVQVLADSVIAELVKLRAWIGPVERLTPLLDEIHGRSLRGSAKQVVDDARTARSTIESNPEAVYRCGPGAVREIMWATQSNADPSRLFLARATKQGFSMARIKQLASEAGIDLEMVRRKSPGPLPLNSIIHWKYDHYAVVLAEKGDGYVIGDSSYLKLYGSRLWVSKAALEEESDGLFLIPAAVATQPQWERLSGREGEAIFGRGDPPQSDNKATTPGDLKTPCANEEQNASGMPHYGAHLMLVSLNIVDIPLRYTPLRGPALEFRATYNQKDAFQTVNPYLSNIGDQWTFDWYSYLEDHSLFDGIVNRYVSGGGVLVNRFEEVGSVRVFQPDRDGGLLQHVPSPGSEYYVLTQPDGSTLTYGKVLLTPARRFYLTTVTDPAGNSYEIDYDAQGRIYRVGDPTTARYLTVHYDKEASLGFWKYKITRVVDPYGRTAMLDYYDSGKLKSITDVGSMTSTFEYESTGSFIDRMTTPYGLSRFRYFESPDGRSKRLEMIDPNGDAEWVISNNDVYFGSEPLPTIPGLNPAIQTAEESLHYRNTFYLNKKATKDYVANQDLKTCAVTYHWLHELQDSSRSGVLESIKPPGESRTWFYYQGQSDPRFIGDALRKPTQIAKVVEGENGNPVTQLTQLEYNSRGNTASYRGPRGRWTTFQYFPNDIDLQYIRQWNGTAHETLAQFSSYSNHRPWSYVDAASQPYALEWNAGRLTKVTNPKQEVTRWIYENDYLRRIERDWSDNGQPRTRTTTFGHDSLDRVNSITDSDNYSLVLAYDALDRLTRVTYPDNTFEEYNYTWLDLSSVWDRNRRVTHITYDAARRPTEVRDKVGRLFKFSWCGCGGLESITDPQNHITSWTYDVQGRLQAKHYPNNKHDTYAYQPLSGRLASLTDGKGQVKTYSYYVDDALKGVTYSGNPTPPVSTLPVTFVYSAFYPRLDSIQDGIGMTAFTYKPVGQAGAGRLHTVDGPWANDLVTYFYDELGRRTTRTINGSSDTYAYDSLGRVSSHASPLGTLEAQYVADTTRLHSLTRPNGLVTTFDYFDTLGDKRLKQIWNKLGDNTVSKFDYEYDVLGRITKWTQKTGLGTPQIMTLDYDFADQLLNATIAPEGSLPTKDYVYSYDKAGNRLSEQLDVLSPSRVSTVTEAIFNNELNQLSSTSGAGPLPVRFMGTVNEPATVTVNGQDAKMIQLPGTTTGEKIFTATVDLPLGNNTVQVVATDLSTNGPNQGPNITTENYSVQVAGGVAKSFTYDDNGNCRTAGTTTYTWDAEDRLVLIERPANLTTEISYDGFGRRARIVEKNNGAVTSNKTFLWCGLELAEERDASGATVTKRFFPEGEQINGTACWFFRDHLGSVRQMVHSLITSYDYDPYGRRTKQVGSLEADFGFTGHYVHAPTGLHLAPFRAYDAGIGRWLSRDPIGEAGGINLYGYVGNSPLGRVDPLGLIDIHGGYIPPGPGGPDPESEALLRDYLSIGYAFLQGLFDDGSSGAEMPKHPDGTPLVIGAPEDAKVLGGAPPLPGGQGIRNMARSLRGVPGVYVVCLKNNGKKYIGQAGNIYERLKNHDWRRKWRWSDIERIFVEVVSDPKLRNVREKAVLLEETGGIHPSRYPGVLNKNMPPSNSP